MKWKEGIKIAKITILLHTWENRNYRLVENGKESEDEFMTEQVGEQNLKQWRVINCKDQSHSWETVSRSAGQGIPSILWNPKFRYRVHSSILSISLLGQLNAVIIFTPFLSNIYFPLIDASFYHAASSLEVSRIKYVFPHIPQVS